MEMAENEAPKPEKMSSGDRFIKDIYLESQGWGRQYKKYLESYQMKMQVNSKSRLLFQQREQFGLHHNMWKIPWGRI